MAQLPCSRDRAVALGVDAPLRVALLHEGRPLGVIEAVPASGGVIQPTEQNAGWVWVDELVEEVHVKYVIGDPIHALAQETLQRETQGTNGLGTIGDR